MALVVRHVKIFSEPPHPGQPRATAGYLPAADAPSGAWRPIGRHAASAAAGHLPHSGCRYGFHRCCQLARARQGVWLLIVLRRCLLRKRLLMQRGQGPHRVGSPVPEAGEACGSQMWPSGSARHPNPDGWGGVCADGVVRDRAGLRAFWAGRRPPRIPSSPPPSLDPSHPCPVRADQTSSRPARRL